MRDDQRASPQVDIVSLEHTLSVEEVVDQDIVTLLDMDSSVLHVRLGIAAEVLLAQGVDLILDVDVLLPAG